MIGSPFNEVRWVWHSCTLLADRKNHLHVHPKFLHSNATSHKWAFGGSACGIAMMFWFHLSVGVSYDFPSLSQPLTFLLVLLCSYRWTSWQFNRWGNVCHVLEIFVLDRLRSQSMPCLLLHTFLFLTKINFKSISISFSFNSNFHELLSILLQWTPKVIFFYSELLYFVFNKWIMKLLVSVHCL